MILSLGSDQSIYNNYYYNNGYITGLCLSAEPTTT